MWICNSRADIVYWEQTSKLELETNCRSSIDIPKNFTGIPVNGHVCYEGKLNSTFTTKITALCFPKLVFTFSVCATYLIMDQSFCADLRSRYLNRCVNSRDPRAALLVENYQTMEDKSLQISQKHIRRCKEKQEQDGHRPNRRN